MISILQGSDCRLVDLMAVEAWYLMHPAIVLQCFARTRTFVIVPVKVYVLSIVGTIRVNVFANTRDLSVNRNQYYVDAEGLVDSGKDITISYKINSICYVRDRYMMECMTISFDLGCSGDLKYVSASRECVESCPCGTFQLFGSCETSESTTLCNYIILNIIYINNNNCLWTVIITYIHYIP